MAKSSRQLLDMGLPCNREAAVALLERLERRLAAEAASGVLMAVLSLLGAALTLLTIRAPAAYRLGYALFFAASFGLSLLYSLRRSAERRAARRLRDYLAAQPRRLPQGLCEKTLGQLLGESLGSAAG